MCQLFGINSDKPYRVNEILERFFENSAVHKDGWGIAVFDLDNGFVEKESVQAIQSSRIKEMLSEDMVCKDMIAHIRKASVGSIEYVNCHPFIFKDNTGRTWTLIHNGTVFAPDLITGYFPMQTGTTDSEAIGFFLMDRINSETDRQGRSLTEAERFACLDAAICELSPDNKLNLMIYDGELLFVHTNMRDTLYELFKDGTRVITTEPLTDEEWTNVPLNTLQAYKDGERIFSGTDHGNEFFQEAHDMSLVYMAYSGL